MVFSTSLPEHCDQDVGHPGQFTSGQSATKSCFCARAAKKSKGEPQATTDKDLTKRTCPAVQTVAKADGGLGPSSKKAEPVQYHLFFMQECSRIVKETPSFKFTEIGKSLVSTWGKLSLTEKTTYKVGVESQSVALV